MNYRHAFHAGNFADVFKHILLTRILLHLARKATPFRVIDTHAGIGIYDIQGPEARRTLEAASGIGRLETASRPRAVELLLSPYLETIAQVRADYGASIYPGSPEFERRLTRPQDRVTLAELHPEDAATLSAHYRRDNRMSVLPLDGWQALMAGIPPKERRGLVLVDPPFEKPDEFDDIATRLVKAWRKWPTGTYAIWYPVKTLHPVDRLGQSLSAADLRKVLRLDLYIRRPDQADSLNGCGLIVINPPWHFAVEAERLLSWLADVLAQGEGSGFRVDWIVPESSPVNSREDLAN
jgi:23S rRNA (adenine2030-N6)-methyltransferase